MTKGGMPQARVNRDEDRLRAPWASNPERMAHGGAGWDRHRSTPACRPHFFAAAAESMRRILVGKARRRFRVRHGGGLGLRKLLLTLRRRVLGPEPTLQ